MANSKGATCCTAALLLLAAASIAAPPEDSAVPAAWQKMMRPAAADDDDDDGSQSQPETCMAFLLALSPCLPFFRDVAGTVPTPAPEGCCEGLRSIVYGPIMCLCHIVNHAAARAVGVDIPVNGAFDLIGGVCRLPVPSPQTFVYMCHHQRAGVPPLYACPAPEV